MPRHATPSHPLSPHVAPLVDARQDESVKQWCLQHDTKTLDKLRRRTSDPALHAGSPRPDEDSFKRSRAGKPAGLASRGLASLKRSASGGGKKRGMFGMLSSVGPR